MLTVWRRLLLQPSEETYRDEYENAFAPLITAVFWVALGAFIGTGLRWLGTSTGLIPVQEAANDILFIRIISNPLLALVLSIPGFLITVGLQHLSAHLVGGSGSFSKFAYLYALIAFPFTVGTGLLNLIPIAGSCISALLGIYVLYLGYLAVKASYRLDAGRAVIVAIVIPVGLTFLYFLCIFAMVVGAN